MLTTSHACIGYLLFEKQSRRERWLAVLGSAIPDATFIVVVPWLLVTDMNHLKQSVAQHTDIYANSVDLLLGQILNSLWLWVVVVALSSKWRALLPVGIAGLVHIVLDALTHQGAWAWNHLYPLKITPMHGIVDFTNPWLFVPLHILWFVIFAPKMYHYLRHGHSE